MAYSVGHVVRVPFALTDVNGAPADDAGLSVVVTDPAGVPGAARTVGAGVVDDAGTGAYHTDITASSAGTWSWVASAPGLGAVSEGQFFVRPAGPMILNLSEVKKSLNKTGTADDEELTDWIGAARVVIERQVGPVLRQTFTEVHGPGRLIVLKRGPVVSITSVTESWGAGDLRVVTAEPPDGILLSDQQYLYDPDRRTLTRRSNGSSIVWGPATVVYVAGRVVVAENIRMAARELITHMWRRSQIASGSSTPRANVAADVAGQGFILPRAVEQLLGSKRAPRLGGS